MKNTNIVQAIKFTLFSISAGIIQIASFSLINELFTLPYYLAYTISLVLSVVWNFTFNRKFTFQSASNVPKAMMLALLFYVPFAPLSIMGGAWLEKCGWNEYLVLALSMIANFSLEFVWQKLVVFRDSYLKQKATQQHNNTQKICCESNNCSNNTNNDNSDN